VELSFQKELEVFDKNGKHLGAIDPIKFEFIKNPVKPRKT